MDAVSAAAKTTPAEPALATPEQRARIEKSAKDFEAQLVSLMLQPMFEGLSTSGPFGGGQAESTYRSFMLDAFGKQMARSGGIGVAGPVMREMLKMQGLR
jgi:Rod binding domain-containing protein